MSVDEQYLQTVMRTLSHDLGGAVRAASGFSELLLKQYSDSLDEKAVRWLNLTKQEGERAQAYLNSFSHYARLYGVSEDKWGECDLGSICRKAMNYPAYLEVASEDSRLMVEIGDLPVIKGCEYLWQQYLGELLFNSAKYSVLDKPVVCKVYSDQVGQMTRLIVEDNGVGMSPENLTKALMPFRQVAATKIKDASSSQSPQGQDKQSLGIGLSLAKRIVEVHHGWFSVESQHGDDSFFRVIATLPEVLST